MEFTSENDKRDKRKGMITTFVFNVVIILLLLWPFFSIPAKVYEVEHSPSIVVEFGNQGAQANSGDTDNASGQEIPSSNQLSDLTESVESSEILADQKITSEVTQEVGETTTSDQDAKPNSENSQKEKEAAEKARLEEAEREAQRVKDAAKKAAYDATKVLNNGVKQDDGDLGRNDIDPNTSQFDGNSYGKGEKGVGGGLRGRGIDFRPPIQENSQKQGTVRVNICVDQSGKVTEAKYTQKNSTISDYDLIRIAEAAASRYKFAPNTSAPASQCGYVTVEFILR